MSTRDRAKPAKQKSKPTSLFPLKFSRKDEVLCACVDVKDEQENILLGPKNHETLL